MMECLAGFIEGPVVDVSFSIDSSFRCWFAPSFRPEPNSECEVMPTEHDSGDGSLDVKGASDSCARPPPARRANGQCSLQVKQHRYV